MFYTAHMKRTFIVFALFCVGSLVVPQPVVAVGSFGITPPYVINHELEPGDEFEQRIFIVRRDASKELQADISWDVPGADNWFTIEQGETFILPAGEQRVPMDVKVTVPEAVAAWQYQGHLQVAVRASEQEAQSGMIAVGLRARAQVDLTVVRDGAVDTPSEQVAGLFFAGLMSGWIWSGLALVLLLFFVLLLRGKWLWRKIRKTQET